MEYYKTYLNKLTFLIKRKRLENKLKKFNITNYYINSDLSIDVNGDVMLQMSGLKNIPFTFNKVSGDFDCYSNNLKCLKGSPTEVGGRFDCSHNELDSLIGSPSEVGGSFYCHNNKLTSLEGCASEIGDCLYCISNNLTSLDCSSYIRGSIYCRQIFKECPEFFGDLNGEIYW